jgi:colicin import membrane protein
MTELDIARGIADGSLSSPQQFGNSFYWNVRVSGTGAAWRESQQEFVWRDAGIWLSHEMCIRCSCIPILMGHPEIGVLNSREFADRCVGNTVHTFVEGDELRGVARILDAGANEILASGGYNDTSPAVVFDPGSGARIEIDGKPCLVEGCPALIDHLALTPRGVWRRDGPPGVENTNTDLDEAA